MRTLKILIVPLLLLILSSCAPMPGNKLLPGVTKAVPLENVEVILTISVWETQKYCTQYAPWHQLLINCIGNGCFVPACSIPMGNNGIIEKCYIYAFADIEYLIEHEKRHCQGYADVFY